MRFPTTKRQKKTFKVAHLDPGDLHIDFIILPVGYVYNSNIAGAKKGDILRLGDGTEHEIFTVQRLQTNKPLADLLCRIRYGITLRGCLMRWKMNAKLEGHGEKAISQDECLMVVYSKDEYDQG